MLLGYAHAQATDHAEPTDDSLRVYAVNIGTNYGIYLGKGLIITAAHVLGSESQPEHIVRITGMDLPAKTIRQSPFELRDLALLSVDEQKLPIYLRMRRMPLCEKAPWVGEPVIVAIPEGTARRCPPVSACSQCRGIATGDGCPQCRSHLWQYRSVFAPSLSIDS
jgi:hypothetical protein